MNCSKRPRVNAALALVAILIAAPVQADLVLRGSDYYQTTQPVAFQPLGVANFFVGLPIGPGLTDTIVQRQGDCSLSLGTAGSQCTVAVELVAMSLVSTTNPSMRLRESPANASTGTLTITSDGSGTGGTFDSFFDIFTELSLDDGATWHSSDPDPFWFGPWTFPLFYAGQTLSINKDWSSLPPVVMFVDGAVDDQNANRHTDKATACPQGNGVCVDFYAVPEPGTFALLVLGLVGLGYLRRKREFCCHFVGRSYRVYAGF